MADHLKTRRPWVLATIMASMSMIAIEATIVATAMPQIAGQLGDLHLYAWVFSSFLLTQTATTVVFGRMADIYGRKPVLLFGIAVFMAGTVLCGFATSMPWLIVFRLIQGVGAGAIQPVALTVVADLYPMHERGRVQGYLASVWGVSSVVGPFIGALIIQHVSWAWIFWMNIPIGIAAAAGYVLFLHEDVPAKRDRIDLGGAALFSLAVAALMIGLTELGTGPLAVTLTAFGISAAATVLFLLKEKRSAAPMLDMELWRSRPILTANLATLLSGMSIIGLTTFLPMYVQGVLGQTALIAGFTLTAMVLGWPIGATIAARNFNRFGLRPTLLFGALLLPIGALVFFLLRPGTPILVVGAGSVVMGLGMGFLSVTAIMIIQSSVGWAARGAATASNIFARNLGSTLGATALGTVFNVSLTGGSGSHAISFDDITRLLQSPAAMLDGAAARQALDSALHITFSGIFVIALLTLLVATLVPKIERSTAAPVEAEAEPAAVR